MAVSAVDAFVSTSKPTVLRLEYQARAKHLSVHNPSCLWQVYFFPTILAGVVGNTPANDRMCITRYLAQFVRMNVALTVPERKPM